MLFFRVLIPACLFECERGGLVGLDDDAGKVLTPLSFF